mmetsp:Transcript_6714/g.19383  ORF Transcript_6714/g.19383 Transcript_6714/m.19383 type:complete len:87 (-) Transcript_6714:1485-1745(-)
MSCQNSSILVYPSMLAFCSPLTHRQHHLNVLGTFPLTPKLERESEEDIDWCVKDVASGSQQQASCSGRWSQKGAKGRINGICWWAR